MRDITENALASLGRYSPAVSCVFCWCFVVFCLLLVDPVLEFYLLFYLLFLYG